MMTKQDFIALADWIRCNGQWSMDEVYSVARFCQQQNSRFDQDRWLRYLLGDCGPNGGKIPGATASTGGTGKCRATKSPARGSSASHKNGGGKIG